MKISHTKMIVYTALCIAMGMILPQLVKSIPVSNPGAVLLPMHLPVLLCGFLCGGSYGVLCGILVPLLTSTFTGRPPMFPTGVSMMLELGAYGVLTGVLYKLTKGKIYITLIGSMLGGRIVMGLANTIFLGFAGEAYGIAAFISAAFVTALPGIIVQIILIPVFLYAMRKAKLMT
jgi:Protein of unknown function (DUF1393).